MANANVPTNTPNDQRLSLLQLADELTDDRLFAHAAWAAAMGLHEGTERDEPEKGLIALIDMLARRLGDRCRQLEEIRGQAAGV